MPYHTELTEDCLGIVHVGNGIVTGEELVEASKAATQLMQNTENFHYEYIDFSDVTELKMTDAELEDVVALDHYAAVFRPEAVVVIVAPNDDLFAIGKKWEQRVRDLGWKTHITRVRAEALRWLRENFPKPPAKGDPISGAGGPEAEK